MLKLLFDNTPNINERARRAVQQIVSTEALHGLVADLRAARADNQRLRAREEELKALLQQWLDLPLAVNGEAGLLRADNQRLREIEDAARAFVATTSYYRQRIESRPEFETLARALLALAEEPRA